MNETNFNVQSESSVESYIKKLLEQSNDPKWLGQWKELPEKINNMPRYQYIDADGLSVVLVCMEKNEDHAQYRLRCRKNGKRQMACIEWTAYGVCNTLGTIYDRIWEYLRMKQIAQKIVATICKNYCKLYGNDPD